MARRKKARGKSRGKSSANRAKNKRGSKRKNKGQVPLEILEKRLGKLNSIVARRGGDAYR